MNDVATMSPPSRRPPLWRRLLPPWRRPWLAIPVCAGLLVALALVFFAAPREVAMGEVQRIFYFHVASAITSLMLFVGCAIASLNYLVVRWLRTGEYLATVSDRVAGAMGEIGVLFGVIVLITGPIWAKPTWGVYWTWEPRLMLMLITVFLFIGYLVLRRHGGGTDLGKRLSAGVAVIGGPAVYLIHVAVELWGGNHPQVMTGDGQGLAPGLMETTFTVTSFAVMAFAGYLVYARYQHHSFEEELEDAYLELSDLEDLEARP